ncbi:hypothetical protein [uncultured Erythrobacter sp.]|uniref:hypothetical protein n=1 Tax=uncultured Erythrobacter sp. TaxID=263913 RepID=UPI002632D580|nr:hypothetical protein [uncultured Erythrobacter sp.]
MIRLKLALGLALAASLAVPTGAALALEALEEAGESDQVTVIEFEAGGFITRVQMPCEDPQVVSDDGSGAQTGLCLTEDRMFIFVTSLGVPADSGNPMSSDFDATYEQIENSSDTVSLDQRVVDGRRIMEAARGPDPVFGLMRAIEFAPEGVAYAVTMTDGDASNPLSEEEKQVMRDFVASLEVAE